MNAPTFLSCLEHDEVVSHVRKMMVKQHLSLRQLARRSEIDASHLSKVLRDKSSLSTRYVRCLAGGLGIEANELCRNWPSYQAMKGGSHGKISCR